ncbi:hypothetical protein OAJ94_02690 [Deltaproteobacteria bacterium]|nr:hypothetical protein [Deltaproteobacteria bacterium]
MGRVGELMGEVSILSDQTLRQLNDEAGKRWPGAWDSSTQRVQVLILCKRRERVILEQHGATIQHQQPVFGLFHRPRHSLHLFESQGFNHRDASFQFLDIATAELGTWLQHLITNDGWKRSSTTVCPLPTDANVPMQRRFENHTILTFRHPDLPELQRLYLAMPLESIVGKAYISYPPGSEAKDSEPVPKVERTPISTHVVPTIPKPSSEPEKEVELEDLVAEMGDDDEGDSQVEELFDGFSADLLESVTHSAAGEPEVETPPVPELEKESPPVPELEDSEPVIKEVPIIEDAPIIKETPLLMKEEAPMTEEVEAPAVPTPSNHQVRHSMPVPSDGGVVDSFRTVIKELLAEGMEASDMMGDPRFAEASEFCEAAGIDTWPMFMEMTGN